MKKEKIFALQSIGNIFSWYHSQNLGISVEMIFGNSFYCEQSLDEERQKIYLSLLKTIFGRN